MKELLDYEKRHIDFLLNNAHEGTLFLKRNDKFPIDKPCKTILVGNGARKTIKGGTGSGDVLSRYFVTFEEGMEKAGFEIVSKEWLDKYDEYKNKTWPIFVKKAKKTAWKNHIFPGVFTMGYFEEETDYDFDIKEDGDLCVYVVARNSGEGNDRQNIKGDVLLSNKEVKDILYLNSKFDKFLLVLNVGGVIDLSPIVDKVDNILYISQLGMITGDILPRIILGKVNPSGKLTTTWAKIDRYPFFNEFGNLHDTYYKEGIYVGYRYFDSIKENPIFPFGYGKSYTDFEISDFELSLNKKEVTVKAIIKNIGNYPGKEVLQIYMSSPQGKINKPYQVLVGYKKTRLLANNEKESVSISFSLDDFSTYDEVNEFYILEKGNYIIRCGNSSRNTTKIGFIKLKEDIICKKVKNNIGVSSFKDYSIKISDEDVTGLKELLVSKNDFITKNVIYKKDEYIDPYCESLSDNELMLLCLGHHKSNVGAMVGNSAIHLVGGAGETTLNINSLEKSLTMADGPAGLRLTQIYGKDKKGTYNITLDPLLKKMFYFLPKFVSHFMKPPKNRHGKIFYQYSTAIPIGTSLAMSFNDDYLYQIGDLIGQEMDYFNVNLWLAPALNIHRNILCGRNFEYYSEDPLVSGRVTAFITKGVQSHKNRGVTIKHFACNNQELNRNNNNSHVSERTFREIYVRGFEYAINLASPKAIMTSYNLVNGVHTSESYPIVNNIIRNEFEYNGLIMSDWITSGNSWCMTSKYKAPYSHNNILAGNDLTMPGCKKDEKYIVKALKNKKLKREDLLYSASRIYRAIKELNKN